MAKADKVLSPDAMRAARLSGLPGVTLAEASGRFKVPLAELKRARKSLGRAGLQPSPELLVVAALSKNGARTKGPLPDLARLAGFIDYVNHDGCTPDGVRSLLAALVADGVLALEGPGWKLLQPWPDSEPVTG